MNESPLQLGRYFVTECKVTANKQFKQKDRGPLDAELVEVEPVCEVLDNPLHWEVTLRVKFQPGPEVNTPYFFTLEIVGFFQVLPIVPDDKVKRLVQINGPSLLYGIAREVVREMTGRGPYAQMFLPSVAFTPPPAPVGSKTKEGATTLAHPRTKRRPPRSSAAKV